MVINLCQHLAATGDMMGVSQVTYEADIAYGRVQNSQALVVLYETMLAISERWTQASPEYKKYYMENVETSFRKAIDELEKVVVMRICELTKMKATGTGEHLIWTTIDGI